MVMQTNIKKGSSCCFWKCYKNLKTSNVSPSELAFPVSPAVNQVQGIGGGLNDLIFSTIHVIDLNQNWGEVIYKVFSVL